MTEPTDVHRLIDALERTVRNESIPGVTRLQLCSEALFMIRALEREVQKYRALAETLQAAL